MGQLRSFTEGNSREKKQNFVLKFLLRKAEVCLPSAKPRMYTSLGKHAQPACGSGFDWLRGVAAQI